MNLIIKVHLVLLSLCLTFSVQAQVADKAEDICPLLVGESIPKATLTNMDGGTVQLSDLIQSKPTVLVFYRGGWCPFCNQQLGELSLIQKEILDLGYQIIAISPDHYQNLSITEEKDSVNYQLYSDPNGALIQKIGIAYRTPRLVKTYVSFTKQIGETSDVLPVPTVMVLNTEGDIEFEYINPNYKVRLSSNLLLAVLKALRL